MKSTCPVINLASARFLEQLDQIEAGVWGTPCSVLLLDGTTRNVSLAWDNRRYSDKDNWLNPSQVAEVRECRFRLPARFAQVIHSAGESGMGYHIYVVELADGAQRIGCVLPRGVGQIDLTRFRSSWGIVSKRFLPK